MICEEFHTVPSVAIEQPIGLTLEIMRMRGFARTWQDVKRPRGEDEEMPSGPMVDWVHRIQALRDRADLDRVLGDDPILRASLATSRNRPPAPA